MSQHQTVDEPGHVAGRSTFFGAEPQLFVADVARACEFYGGKLGFTVSFIYGEPAFYAQVARGEARLNLRHVDAPVIDPAVREAEQLLSATITLGDAAPVHAEYVAAGVEFAQPLRDEEWGARTFIVRDPDGNLVLFAGSGAATP